MQLKVKKLHPDAIIPQYAKQGDSGFDLVATEDVIIEPGETKLIKTGLAFEIPHGYEIQIRPRSGITLKTKLRVQLGTVDSGYRGEVGVIVDNIGREFHQSDHVYTVDMEDVQLKDAVESLDFNSYIIRKGERIAQAVIQKVEHATFEEVEELQPTERGDKGYGSTGT